MDKEENRRVQRPVNNENGEFEISLLEIFGALKKHIFLIILCFALGVGAAFFYLSRVNSVYSAQATVMVNPITNASSIDSLLNLGTSTSKIDTEVQLITSESNLREALQRLDLSKYTNPEGVPYSAEGFEKVNLKKKVSISTVSNTNLVTVSVKDTSPQFAADYTNSIMASYSDLLSEIARNSKSKQREFLENQIPVTEALLAEASSELSEYKEKYGIEQLAQTNGLLTSKIAFLQLEKEPLQLQLIEAQSLVAALNQDSKLASVRTISEDAAVQVLVADYIANSKEYIMYHNVDSVSNSTRATVLESALSSKAKEIQNAVVSIIGISSPAYAKAVSDCICVQAYLDAIEDVVSVYSEDLADYPLIERKYLDLQRNVQIYEQLLLSLRQLLEETRMVEAAVVGNVVVVDPAQIPLIPVSPRKVMILAVAALAGMALGMLASVIIEFSDPSITSEETVRSIVGGDCPSLGWTPYIKDVDNIKLDYPSLFIYNDPDASISEKIRAIANNITYSTPDKLKIFSLNSTDMSEGKTTLICNVATAYALIGKKTLIVDADFRRPAVEAFFNLKKSKQGLVDAVVNDVPLEQCIIRPIEKIPTLHILPPGMGTRNPNAFFSSNKTVELFDRLKEIYDYIILDVPPLSYGSEFTHIAKHLDGFILIIRAGVTQKGSLVNLVKNLEFVKAKLLGFVFHGVIARNQSYYGGYGYGYNGKYGTYRSYSSRKYGKYGYGYGYGYGGSGKTIYHEGHGSYARIHEKEMARRNSKKDRYGKNEPVLAFPDGIKMNQDRATQKASVQAKEEKKSGEQVTSDMLADIEEMFSKNELS